MVAYVSAFLASSVAVHADKLFLDKATIVGSMFSEYVDTVFAVSREQIRLLRTFPDGEEHKPAYRFVTLVT